MSQVGKGDVVRLKSGSHRMTVEDTGNYEPTGPSDGALCVWIEGNKILREMFDRAALEKMPAAGTNGHTFTPRL